MRGLRCYQTFGVNVQDVLDEFNERMEEFGISPKDVLSVTVLSPTSTNVKIHNPNNGGTLTPKVEVIIVYWTDQ